MKVSIIGAGYVGLVTGVGLADKGHRVCCVDIDENKVESIKKGVAPFFEEGLDELLKKNIGKNLKATTNTFSAVLDTDVSIVAVGTPFDGKEIDLKFVEEASAMIGEALKEKPNYHLIVVKSTVVPGTTDEVVTRIIEETSGKKAGKEFGVGVNPEFLKQGEAVRDFLFPDRIVLGGMDKKSIEMLEQLYSVFGDVDIIKTNNNTAEMIKYTANGLLTTMISFSNEIGNLCAMIDNVDVVDVMKGVHLDKRLSPIMADGNRLVPAFTTYLEAGCGFGGSCFPKDLAALNAYGERIGSRMRLLKAVLEINQEQPEIIISLLKKHIPKVQGVWISILGLAFKPGTDDMRSSPAVPIIKALLSKGAKIKAYDPIARENAQKIFSEKDVLFCNELSQAVENVEAIVILTRWDEFKNVPKLIGNLDNQPLTIDGRRMLDKNSVLRYEGIGL